MRRDVLAQHATDCRQLAGEYASEERDFLLQVASEFDRLAERDGEDAGSVGPQIVTCEREKKILPS